eukprot:31058-Pelagococcus_subviridis.AAC.5
MRTRRRVDRRPPPPPNPVLERPVRARLDPEPIDLEPLVVRAVLPPLQRRSVAVDGDDAVREIRAASALLLRAPPALKRAPRRGVVVRAPSPARRVRELRAAVHLVVPAAAGGDVHRRVGVHVPLERDVLSARDFVAIRGVIPHVVVLVPVEVQVDAVVVEELLDREYRPLRFRRRRRRRRLSQEFRRLSRAARAERSVSVFVLAPRRDASSDGFVRPRARRLIVRVVVFLS